jgi:Inosine-uridine preferring nucleoside hydrolase
MRHTSTITICLLAMLLLSGMHLRAADKPRPIPIVLDTDIGTDIDDAFALALVLDSPELDLRAVTTVSGDTTSFMLPGVSLLRRCAIRCRCHCSLIRVSVRPGHFRSRSTTME